MLAGSRAWEFNLRTARYACVYRAVGSIALVIEETKFGSKTMSKQFLIFPMCQLIFILRCLLKNVIDSNFI